MGAATITRTKRISSPGASAPHHVEWTVAYDPDSSTRHLHPVYAKPDWAKGFDVVVHDECSADVRDLRTIETILKPHKEGLPGVVLHCAKHCYRTEGWNRKIATPWMQFTGLISTGHGPQDRSASDSLTKTLRSSGPWPAGRRSRKSCTTTPQASSRRPLRSSARGKQGSADAAVVWTNIYNGKTRVFGTTLGHNNQTVADPRFLDLVTRGLLWSVDKLDDQYLKEAGPLVPEDLARGKTATASSTQGPEHAPALAVDGNPATRWCANGPSIPVWWQVDLGKSEDLTGVRILWEQNGVEYQYKVEGSDDTKAWTMLSDQTKSHEPTRSVCIPFSPEAFGTCA